ncbi:copper resistance D [Shewanella denitrificans OS217]|uniref:Copper resistance protein D n=1 Tax=Shewanella denitrificans (strain OS217 / ATCC BAA-1090 / DSM 15013) TaxID=318161 RepID=Q12IA8_SHEDO|nr:CopD family protein [Shewanella denitrificans]ABE56818.1 copper resistance D [Shewanella denitrificans OS217]
MVLTEFEILALLSKWLMYLSVATVIGGAFMLVLTHSLARTQASEMTHLYRYIGCGAVLGLLAVTINFFVQVGSFAEDGIGGMLDQQMQLFMWQSPVGESLAWRVAGFSLALFGSSGALLARQGVSKLANALLAMGVIALGTSFSLIGHSTELNFWAQGLVVLHILVIGSWLGSFYPLWRMCSSASTSSSSGVGLSDLKAVMDKFGQLGVMIVSLVLATGAALVWMLFDSPMELIDSDYGRAILLKLSLIVLILLIAALHKFILVPKLESPLSVEAEHSARIKLKRSIAIEAMIGALILAVTVMLSSVLGPVSLS